jgi:hypothetical protein
MFVPFLECAPCRGLTEPPESTARRGRPAHQVWCEIVVPGGVGGAPWGRDSDRRSTKRAR